MRLSNF
jgi:hypothetical protein